MQICKIKEFTDKIQYSSSRPLRGLSVELTRRCNFGCHHCFLANPVSNDQEKSELSYDEWLRIFDEYIEEQGLFITVTGGEPLLRKDFKDLYMSIKKRGLFVTLFTNGSLVDEEMADFLAKWTPYQVSISLYGSSEETYRKVTGRKNMYARVRRTLDLLRDRGVPLEVKGVFTKLNIDEFHEIKSIGEEYCDLFRWDVDLIGAFPTSGNRPQDIRLSPEEVADFEASEPIRNQELLNRVNNWQPPDDTVVRKGAFSCGVGRTSAYICAEGRLQPCLPLERVSYDLKRGTLNHGWHKVLPELLDTFKAKPGPCQSCNAIEFCGQCVAFALLEGCSPTGPVPFKCRLAKRRVDIYGLENKISIRGIE